MQKIMIVLLVLTLFALGSFFVYSRYYFPKEDISNTPEYPLPDPYQQSQKKEVTEKCTNMLVPLEKYAVCTTSNYSPVITLKYDEKELYKDVTNYSVSPNKNWIVISKVNENGAESAPQAESLLMINTNSQQVTELISYVYFPAFTSESWSPNGNGIVLSTGNSSDPEITKAVGKYNVVYCELTCRNLATDAGPEGLGAQPAYFEDGKVVYTNWEGVTVYLDL